MKKRSLEAWLVLFFLGSTGGSIEAATSDTLDEYTLDAMVVEADREKNKFGDIVTEQSYYRTGGDVDVITSEDIAQRHYVDMTSAIKTLPGVQVNSIGYHGGEYGAGTQYNTTVTINGDDRVVVCLDGRRVDNAVSGLMSSRSANWTKALTNLDQVTSIDNVEKSKSLKDRVRLNTAPTPRAASSTSSPRKARWSRTARSISPPDRISTAFTALIIRDRRRTGRFAISFQGCATGAAAPTITIV